MSRPTLAELRAKLVHIADLRPVLGTPYSYPIDGETWTIASDGWGLLALRRDDGCPLPSAVDPKGPEFVGAIEPRPTKGWLPVDTGALLAWFNAAAPDPAHCKHCEGKGTRLENQCANCEGSGIAICICPTCDDDHETDCEVCEGKPRAVVPCGRCDEPRELKGWMGVALMNRANVWRWLSWLPADEFVEVSVTHPERSVRFRGNDWFALVMPMRNMEQHATDDGRFDGWLAVPAPSPGDTPQ